MKILKTAPPIVYFFLFFVPRPILLSKTAFRMFRNRALFGERRVVFHSTVIRRHYKSTLHSPPQFFIAASRGFFFAAARVRLFTTKTTPLLKYMFNILLRSCFYNEIIIIIAGELIIYLSEIFILSTLLSRNDYCSVRRRGEVGGRRRRRFYTVVYYNRLFRFCA